MKPILEVLQRTAFSTDSLIPYGHWFGKIDPARVPKKSQKGHLILVTAMSPTPKGEGKTTTTIGLGDGLNLLGEKTLICLRQPSMGPCFGVKGGATGGGKAMLTPMEDINLNFTGDFHAITSAHNLLSAMIDNHIHWGNELNIDPTQIKWKRVMDMNERSLRSGFDITVASEVMAAVCLSIDLMDLQENLGRIIVATSKDGRAISAKDLKAPGAMTAILKNTMKPNLVQTLEGNPALVHGGPFANIAHGCNSLAATKLALENSDYVVTEAGFGADLGAEKFLNIKCRKGDIWPSCAVLVATVRSLKYHGGGEDLAALEKGFANLERHIQNLKKFSLKVVVAINRFTQDTESELKFVKDRCQNNLDTECVVNNSWAEGSQGSKALGEAVIKACSKVQPHPKFLYPETDPLLAKIETIAFEIYRASSVVLSPQALTDLKNFEKMGYGHLPVCMAKNQYSFSSNPKALGAVDNHTLEVREVRLNAGAGFVVGICGSLMTMPGLPKAPAAESITVDSFGVVHGLF